ncbi:radical SAM protein [Chondromyces crocatus]|uniref:Radical SAM protein n=2 Tax=Chondromyces crocatus TaxID=52 RepID=A0A0K1E770_CHOCO|nr:radical SAM protein [Chondromyces crocatus]
MTYVYPVVSRRAGGVSVGVNLNPNNACNWRCVYCQVPDLTFGKGPAVDLVQLEQELRGLLEEVTHGDFMERCVPEGVRRLNDVAFSGNGEPTTSPQFGEAVDIAGQVLEAFGLLGSVKLVLITNGSMLNKRPVADAIARMATLNGEVWFKLDSFTAEGARRINHSAAPLEEHLARLSIAASACPTWLQTCLFSWDGQEPVEEELVAYLEGIRALVERGVPVRGVLLYTVARPSMQPEASRLEPLPETWLRAFAARIEAAGLPARVSA